MDRAEAVKILEIQLDVTDVNTPSCIKLHEALDLAIEALQEATGDYEFFGGEYAKEGDAESATTTHGRLIDADALLKPIEESWKHAGLHAEDYKKIKKWIKNAPTVEPPKKVIAQIKVDTDEIVERIKEEYEIKDLPVCEDCISRQQAIEQIDKWHDFYADSSLRTDKARRDELSAIKAMLINLPSLPPVTPTEQTDCTDFINWILDEVMDEENWELNAVANGEIICRKLKKLDLLEVKDGYYVRASVTPTERTGEWIETESDEPCWYRCSECARRTDEPSDYCPNCGAKMVDGGDV